MAPLRVLWVGWVTHFKIVSRSPFAVGVGATWPIVNATLAYFMYSAGGRPSTLPARSSASGSGFLDAARRTATLSLT